MRPINVAVRVTAAAGVLLLLAACAPEQPEAGRSPSRSPSASASASPRPSSSPSATAIPSPSVVPGPTPSVTPDPVPSQTGSADGWTYTQLRTICVDWVQTRSPKNQNEQWEFDNGEPAQRFGGSWNLQFIGTFDDPNIGSGIQAAISCAVTGSPADYAVGQSDTLGDALPEALLYP